MSGRRAAVVGHPIAHSLSPVLHNAGYAAAGLAEWTYDALDLEPGGALAQLLHDEDPRWAGISVTMPLKGEALSAASGASSTARLVGAANTLIRRPTGWYADNTDVTGMGGVLQAVKAPVGGAATVLGAGGTARAVLAALGRYGVKSAVVVARRAGAVAALHPIARAVGLRLRHGPWDRAAEHLGADVVVSALPPGVADDLAGAAQWAPDGVYVDVLYDPWPTPLATAAAAAGVRVASGLDLLLAQSFDQFTHFTGEPAPQAAMRAALLDARPDWVPADHGSAGPA
ncbi:shikimate 5-dehydrogenase [Pilimelia anulata]|uniref:Shikimate 5-dehydrogenase n=1 Tax=Pilimelia anulata TaxID=53371 RepID=A0A8J3B9C5_9ACTN|nr:shikimate dehydrogenase [Pilimelia anulata]GGJ86439.1 shikimate 5-dehydrogenase [Pilimelia anulata]